MQHSGSLLNTPDNLDASKIKEAARNLPHGAVAPAGGLADSELSSKAVVRMSGAKKPCPPHFVVPSPKWFPRPRRWRSWIRAYDQKRAVREQKEEEAATGHAGAERTSGFGLSMDAGLLGGLSSSALCLP